MSTRILAVAALAMAAAPLTGALAFGKVERVKVMGTAPIEVKARLDGGGEQTLLYALNVKYFQKEGDTWVRFTIDNGSVLPGNHVTLERKVLKDIRVKANNGGVEHRAVVEVDLCVGEQALTSTLIVADRSGYTEPLVFGRGDLAKLGPIDRAREYTREPTCKPPEPAPPAAAPAKSAKP